MGFRSTLISQDYRGALPEWFMFKYKDLFNFAPPVNNQEGILVSSKWEHKIYTNEIFIDYQKALNELGFRLPVTVAVLAEDGFITKVVITKDKIKYFYMKEDSEEDGVWAQ